MAQRPNPRGHSRLVSVLDSVAVLLGHFEDLRACLPDGSRPDVLRCDRSRRRLFIGEARNTEHWSSAPALHRLDHYLGWATSLVRQKRASVIVAVASRVPEWCEIVNQMLLRHRLVARQSKAARIDHETYICAYDVRSAASRRGR